MTSGPTSVAVILGSAFDQMPEWLELEPRQISTPYGDTTLHALPGSDPPAFALFRHGVPHSLLPHQIPYRANTWALKEVGCGALLVTSSVGVLFKDIPVFQPLLVSDLIMLDNRLPDGSTLDTFPADAEVAESLEPIHEELPGWSRPTEGVVDENELPPEAKNYLAFLEDKIGVPAVIVSTGPRREETLIRGRSELAEHLRAIISG